MLHYCPQCGYITHMNTYGGELEAALAHQIKVELAERGMEQKDLAEAAAVERVTLNRYLKGHRSMPMPVFFRVAAALGINPAELMDRAEARIHPKG